MPNLRAVRLVAVIAVAVAFAFAVAFGPAGSAGAAPKAPSNSNLPDAATLQRWVVEMKESPKGPFSFIRWFCADGTVHPAKPYPCENRGGGIQHGLWNDRVTKMRDEGVLVANLFAEVEPERYVGADPALDRLNQILLERFLVSADDGWIFRGAFGYRGAFQIEDEEAGARRLIDAMLADPGWHAPARFWLVRESVRLLPLQSDADTASKVRRMAVEIANDDPGFARLRAKIHGAPDAGDAAAVRAHAAARGKPDLAAKYEEIASDIDALYAASGVVDELRALAESTDDASLAKVLREGADALAADASPEARLTAAGMQLAALRERFQSQSGATGGLALLQASLALEREAYAAGNTLLARLDATNRRGRLRWVNLTADSLYGAGFLSRRQFGAVRRSINDVASKRSVDVAAYRALLRYLARTPEWASRWIEFNVGTAVARFAPFEPLAHLYAQDRLRGSPLLFFGAVLDSLVLDANELAGVRGELFGTSVGAGLRALNPGLARGAIYAPADVDGVDSFDRDGIYLLPETTSDLPPVSGILTQGEGSSLSHVQLLARNLGIPNVVVSESLLPQVRKRVGERAVMAVSPGGVVQLNADGPKWNAIFGEKNTAALGSVEIRPNLEKLNLSARELIPLDRLRAADSGRTSGPKGANLGELKHYFGDKVPNGFVIPFGIFRQVLDKPLEPGGPPVFEWMQSEYEAIDGLSGDAKQKRVSKFLARLRAWIENVDIGTEFTESLRSMMQKQFGTDGTYGVFVRSDTNVEDLPGFTGAGLNLTVFNVVGFDNVVKAIHAVWASPFTERAYGWRQGNMTDPAYVFPAVVVQLGFPSEKSGVLVTADVDQGVEGWMSVAVSEGVGGAVDGQAAESLRIHRKTGEVQLLAQATAPKRNRLSPTGGVDKVPSSGASALLQTGEIQQLIALAKDVERFPTLRDEEGNLLPADIEFGFKDGQLALLQIRPFVENASAQQNRYLLDLDAELADRARAKVDLDAVP